MIFFQRKINFFKWIFLLTIFIFVSYIMNAFWCHCKADAIPIRLNINTTTKLARDLNSIALKLVGAGRPIPVRWGQNRTVVGTVSNIYHIRYPWKAVSVCFRLALEFRMSDFSIKCYGMMHDKKLSKKREKKPKKFLLPYMYAPIGIDFSGCTY